MIEYNLPFFQVLLLGKVSIGISLVLVSEIIDGFDDHAQEKGENQLSNIARHSCGVDSRLI